jgi:Ca2+-binding EF-hand superfamily protein
MNKLSLTALILGSGLALAGTVLAGPDCHDGKAGAGRMGRFDGNKDGKVTLAELVESKQSWLREVDGNKDGVATRTEIEASLQARRTEHVNQLLARQDKNKDGRITREESAMPERWFARTDANSDGALSREELSQRGGKHGEGKGHGGKRAKGAEMDTNSDGKIDAAEVKSSAERMLKRLDKNADGALEGDELKWRGRGRGHGGQRGAEQQGTGASTERI